MKDSHSSFAHLSSIQGCNWVRRAGVIAILTAICSHPCLIRGQDYIVDQRNDRNAPFDTPGYATRNLQVYSPCGQEFRPNLSTLSIVEFATQDFAFSPGNGIGASLLVHIRESNILGPVLGISDLVTLLDGFSGITRFHFPLPVSLVPGRLYVMELAVQSGDNWGVADTAPYPAGNMILNGVSEPGTVGMWFREGVPVPEPSAILLMTIGFFGTLAWRAGKAAFDRLKHCRTSLAPT